MTEEDLFDKFYLRPTAKLRLAATTFLIEKILFPYVNINRRVTSRKVAERLTNVIYLVQKGNSVSRQESQDSRKSQKNFDYRTWEKWCNGNVISEPTYISSICNAVGHMHNLARFIDGTYLDNSIKLHFYALDVFASKHSNAKLRAANNILKKIESIWAVDKAISQVKIPDHWLNEIDKNKPLRLRKPPKIIDDMFDYDYYCEKSKLHCFSIDKDVSKRFEVDSPFLLLPYLLRNVLYLNKNNFIPINTFAVDLATTALAIGAIMYSRDNKSAFSGPKIEAFDAAQGIFFGSSINHTRHIISSRAPWEREIYDNSEIVRNIVQVKTSYRKALNDVGVISREMKKVYQNSIKF